MAYLPWEECESFDDFQNLLRACFPPESPYSPTGFIWGIPKQGRDCCERLFWASEVLMGKHGAAGSTLLAGPLPVTTCKCVLEVKPNKWSCWDSSAFLGIKTQKFHFQPQNKTWSPQKTAQTKLFHLYEMVFIWEHFLHVKTHLPRSKPPNFHPFLAQLLAAYPIFCVNSFLYFKI